MTATRDIETAAVAAIEEFLDTHPSVPGLLFRSESDAGTVEVALGYEDSRRTIPMEPDAPFRVASNTKTFVATAVLRLSEQGIMELDAPVSSYVAEPIVELLEQGGYDPSAITVRHLLQHTSGIADHSQSESGKYEGSPYLVALRADPQHRWTPEEQVEFSVARFPPVHAPGKGWRYTDTGYVILALLLQEVTGLRLAVAMRTLCRLDSLGLSSTWLESLEEPRRDRPICRHYFGDWDATDLDPSADLYGGGGLVSTTKDLIRFWRALFGVVIYRERETLQLMLDPLEAGSEKAGEAGLGLFRRNLGGTTWWSHTGMWGSFVFHSPEHRISVAAFRNQHLVPAGAFDRMLEPILAAHMR